jgi:hypothetical protein
VWNRLASNLEAVYPHLENSKHKDQEEKKDLIKSIDFKLTTPFPKRNFPVTILSSKVTAF